MVIKAKNIKLGHLVFITKMTHILSSNLNITLDVSLKGTNLVITKGK